jgi:DNA-binding GntR family transcriptional regulator
MSETSAAPPIVSIAQRERLAESVAEVLREQILSGETRAGTQLLQIGLAERLGVSRTPLREAFRLLERDGLVRISNGNKTVEVVGLGVQDVIDALLVRQVVDGLAARLAAERDVDDALVSAMGVEIDIMDRACGTEIDRIAYGPAHARWHLLLLEASGNRQVDQFDRLVRLSSHRLMRRQLDTDEMHAFSATMDRIARTGNAEHKRILDAIVNEKSDVAEQTAIKHIGRSIKWAQDVLNRRAKRSR